MSFPAVLIRNFMSCMFHRKHIDPLSLFPCLLLLASGVTQLLEVSLGEAERTGWLSVEWAATELPLLTGPETLQLRQPNMLACLLGKKLTSHFISSAISCFTKKPHENHRHNPLINKEHAS